MHPAHLCLVLLSALTLGACVHTPPPPPPAPPPVAIPAPVEPEPSMPRQALPTRYMVSVTALSDADAMGPVVEMQAPPGGAMAQRGDTTASRLTQPLPVRCKAVRSRDAVEEKITISCRNTSRQTQTVFLQINAAGMSGVPSATKGHALAPKVERVLATLVTTHQPAWTEIWYTHQARR